jgi:hypothetical protein
MFHILCALFSYTTAVPAQGFNTSTAVVAASLLTATASNSSDCYQSWLNYRSTRDSFLAGHASSTVETDVYIGTSTMWGSIQTGATYTTLCDGQPRPHGTPSFFTNTTYLSTAANTSTIWPTYAAPTPSCSLDSSVCSTLWNDYALSSMTYSLDGYARQKAVVNTSAPVPPVAPACSRPADLCGPCEIHGLRAHLAYWPVTTVANPKNASCGAPGVTIAPNVTGIGTAVRSGVTMTSPTAYIWVESMVSHDGCLTEYIENMVLTVPPREAVKWRWHARHR